MRGIGFNMVSSGSSGNCTLIWDQDTLLVIDFGISLKRLKSRVKELGITNPEMSLFVSHEHSDHSSGIRVLMHNMPVDVYTRRSTAETLGLADAFPIRDTVTIGNFVISASSVSHDAVDPVAYTVQNGKAKISIVSDLGYVTPGLVEIMKGSQVVALEANHDVDMLKSGSYPYPLKKRILGEQGHLSNAQTSEALEKVSTPETRIILTHLSQENNTPDMAKQAVSMHLINRGIGYHSIECASQDLGSSVYNIDVF
ncbi:MAG: MBL fold metallo-hydrolase [Thermoplasmataceae archaeon]